jgi:hypothetical protein
MKRWGRLAGVTLLALPIVLASQSSVSQAETQDGRGIGLGAAGALIGGTAAGGQGSAIGATVGGVGVISAPAAKSKTLNLPTDTRSSLRLGSALALD